MSFEEERRTHIGGSDVGTILDCNPFMGQHKLFLVKLGLDEVEQTEEMQTGLEMEEFIRNKKYYPRLVSRYGKDAKITITTEGFLEHPEHSWLGVHIDGLVEVDNIIWGVDYKNSSSRMMKYYGEEYTDDVPKSYWWQCQTYMEVFSKVLNRDIDRWDLAVLFGGQKFRVYTVRRDQKAFNEALPKLKAFYDRVQNNDPPPPDGSPEYVEFLSKFYAKEEEKDMEPTDEIDSCVDAYLQLKAAISEAETDLVALEGKICELMKEHTRIVGPNYVVKWKWPTPQRRTDAKKLIELTAPSAEILEKCKYLTQPKKRSFSIKPLESEGELE